MLCYVKLSLLVFTHCRELIIVPSRLSLNDVRSNGGICLYARLISAKNYTLTELLKVYFEKLCSYYNDRSQFVIPWLLLEHERKMEKKRISYPHLRIRTWVFVEGGF